MQAGRHDRRIRSFVRREGRFTPGQKKAFATLWPRYGVDPGSPIDCARLFGREASCTLEIGFGNGDNLAELAANEPANNFIGVEVHRPGVGRLLQTLEQRDIANVRISRQDAVEVLEQQLGPGSIDRVLILFPDPWHKKRHHKRRLIQAGFIDLLATRIRPGGTLHIATDWEDYAGSVLELLNNHAAFSNAAPGGQTVERPAWRIKTRFEQRGERLGHAVFDLLFTRR